jgi:hypothetical protein
MPVADSCRSQRAFRERKEKHVRDLELKISAFKSTVFSLQSANERLTLAVQSLSTENEILRASVIRTPGSSSLQSASNTSVGTRLSGERTIDDRVFSVHPLHVRNTVSVADKQHADSYRNTNSTSVSGPWGSVHGQLTTACMPSMRRRYCTICGANMSHRLLP